MRGLRDDGACVLISSHALAELEGQADRVVVLSRGRKVADGTLSTLRQLAGIRPLLRMRMSCGSIVDTACDEAALAGLLRTLPPGATDIEIVRPSLDEIYAAFLRQEDVP